MGDPGLSRRWVVGLSVKPGAEMKKLENKAANSTKHKAKPTSFGFLCPPLLETTCLPQKGENNQSVQAKAQLFAPSTGGNERCKDGWIRVSVRCVSGQSGSQREKPSASLGNTRPRRFGRVCRGQVG